MVRQSRDKAVNMHEMALVALWEHFNLDTETAVWWYNDVEPRPLPPTSSGVTCAQIATMEPLQLYQTVRRDPCL